MTMHSKPVLLAVLLLSLSPLTNAVAANAAEQCNQSLANGDTTQALLHAEEALRKNDRDREALLCKGRVLSEKGQHDVALDAMQQAVKLSATPIERIIALTLSGNVQRSANRPDAALENYRQSLAIAQAEHDSYFERIDRNLIGESLAAQSKLDEALEHYLAGEKLAANDTERADSYARIAETYSSLGQHDKAVEYQIKSMLSEERSGDFNRYAYASLELGRIHMVAADYANAEKVLNRIIARSKAQEANYWEAKGYYYLALEKAASGKPDEARSLLDQAQQLSKGIGADALNNEISQTLSKMSR